MLENIKSLFFTRMLFSYIDEKYKLKIIKYNKNLQKIINISLSNYIHFKGKYIIYESEDFGREYYGINDKLIFEGEYYNGERNGIGKEYNEYGYIIYEGEFLNGKRRFLTKYDNIIIKKINISGNGKGEEYDKFGNLLFEGEYLYGDRSGKGKEYYGINNMNDKLMFEGEYLNDKRNGKGKEYYDNGNLKFEGEYFNNKEWNGKRYDLLNNIIYELKDGKGFVKEYNYENKLIFVGEYSNGVKNGKGKEYENGYIIFEGEYSNGKRNGKGKEFDYSGDIIFEGEYLNGQRHGKGKEYNNNKDLNYLLLSFLDNKSYPTNKLLFEGEYLYDFKIRGKYYINQKLEYEGEFLYNKKWSGNGYDENGNIAYIIKNGNGYIKEYYDNDKLKFEGEYLNGKRNGKGKEYYDDGQLKFEAEYLNGKIIKKRILLTNNKIYEIDYLNEKVKIPN